MKTKKITSTFLAIISFGLSMALANDKYLEAMQKNIELVYSSKVPAEIQGAVNSLERIGDAEKTKWEPFYYASFGYVMLANQEQDKVKKDSYLDLALKLLEKAKGINSNESEIVALEGFVHMIRVTIDPASRGQQYSGMAFQSFNRALELNPENPRALGLMAQMQFGTAQFFGSPTTEACATAYKALQLFMTATNPENLLSPSWGKGMTEGMIANCK